MQSKTYYAGIDYARLIAALLIVAIHTSPLASFSALGDFVLTRIAARVAVPFFLMASGFFVVSRYSTGDRKFRRFEGRTALIYAAAILLYLPINWYNGYFTQPKLLSNLLKDVVFNGTLYHLWYLPAAMTGGLIAWALVRKLDYKKAFLISGVLYLVGLFGDSYYGLAVHVPALNWLYGQLFHLFNYTRNGLFLAPLFFVLGSWCAAHRLRSVPIALTGFGVSLGLMCAEALTLRCFQLQRHDSMYVFLVPAMFFLFQLLLGIKGRKIAWLKPASLLIYIIHPAVIIVVRLAARVLHLKALLVDNSLVHYLAVCAGSVALSVVVTLLYLRWTKKRTPPHNGRTSRAWLELDSGALVHNANVLRAAMPRDCQLMAVLKAEAYGHGAVESAALLERSGVRAFAVATIDEGIQLRRGGVRGEILVLGCTDPARARELHRWRLTQTAADFAHAKALNQQGVKLDVHIKIDTGMHRLGIPYDRTDEVRRVFGLKNLRVTGMFSHFCCADSRSADDVAFTRQQIDRFYALTDALKQSGIALPRLHLQSSYGLLNYPELHCDYVRAGITLYGVLSAPEDETVLDLDLRPALSLKAKVALIRTVAPGETAGYGRAFAARRETRLAILPIGYADGYPRSLSCGRGLVRIGAYTVPVAGRVCMDQLAVDITDAPGGAVGDTAILFGADSPTALETAARTDSITNELLSRMGRRLPVVVK